MKNFRFYFLSLITVLAITMSSCEVIGDIFEAGMWTAVIIIVLIILVVGWLISKIRR